MMPKVKCNQTGLEASLNPFGWTAADLNEAAKANTRN